MPYRPPQTLHALAPGEHSATLVRYRVVGLLVLMAVLLYLDRFCITPVTHVMIGELGVDKEQFGRAVGGFFLAYALMQVPAGRLSDRFGTRFTLTGYVALWSLVTLAFGFAHGLTAIFVLRVLLGVFQAGAYPAAAAAIKNWTPLAERARASSCVSTGGRLGGLLAIALTPVFMHWVAMYFGWTTGLWRPVFMVYGGLGLVWAAAFWWRHRDMPRHHPSCNAAEVARIEHDQLAEAGEETERLPLVRLISNGNLWVLCSINFLLNVGWVFLVTWMPTYLGEAYGEQLDEVFSDRTAVAGILTAATGLAGMLGNLSGGWWGDRAVARYGLRWGRRVTGLVSSVLAALVYFTAQWTGNLWIFVAEMVAISFLSDLVLGSLWATYQDIGRRNTAVVLGFANMCGNLGAAGYGWLIGYLAREEQWTMVFAISSVGFGIAAVCWLVVDATRVLKAK